MKRTIGAVVAAAVMAVSAGCDGLGPLGSDAGAPEEAPKTHIVLMSRDGCELLEDITPVQEYLGVTAIRGDGLMSSDYAAQETPSCQGMFDLAAWNDSDRHRGDATVSVSVTTRYTAEEVAGEYRSMIDQLTQGPSPIELEGAQEGEVAGEWDESYFIAGELSDSYHVYLFARYDHWVLRVNLDVSPDPGVAEYERDPERYPDSSAEQMAAYPFTMPELLEWATTEYAPQTQQSILDLFAMSEKASG
ncbi:hypothetical protein [Stackebrandtia albiflava]|uniref:hypothetical protein n=1 Tax=Stackebrandtia albiflava TaxID=406432 RepID=UPI0011BE3E27|nr:hypothetical protein [Stackebrandtia albiflava]